MGDTVGTELVFALQVLTPTGFEVGTLAEKALSAPRAFVKPL